MIWLILHKKQTNRLRNGKTAPKMNSDPIEQKQLQLRLAELQSEHRDLDDVISRISHHMPVDQLQIQRLKKRKLALKDEITKIENLLLPDIIA